MQALRFLLAGNWQKHQQRGWRTPNPVSLNMGGNRRRRGWWNRASFTLKFGLASTVQRGPSSDPNMTPSLLHHSSRVTRFDAQPFHLLLCRRLHLPLPLTLRTCRCGRQLDMFGHHRAACADVGVLGKRGFPLECAAAQICREAGARVATNVWVRDMDLGEFNALDGRRLEVVADGLSLWRGAQLAIDTTLVSSLPRRVRFKKGRKPRRSCPAEGEKKEGGHVPGAVRRRWSGTPGCIGSRSWWSLERRDRAVFVRSRQL